MIRLLGTAPDIDVKNIIVSWPQEYIEIYYRICMLALLPMVTELLRVDTPTFVPYVVIMFFSIIGMIILFVKRVNIFPNGRNILLNMYILCFTTALLSLIYAYTKAIQYIFIALDVVIVVAAYLIFKQVFLRQNKKVVDNLYSKFDDLIEHISSPKQCIDYMRVGLIYNAPCVYNHTLITWGMSRWPADQKLLLASGFIYYVLNVQYKDILETISNAVDLQPLDRTDTIFFFQIFKRLPTREAHLSRSLESVRRMYNIPKSSQRLFWESCQQRQWDEALMRAYNLNEDLDHINAVFTSLIFDNPSSDIVMQEFIKFADTIQGNHIIAAHAQAELNRRQIARAEDKETTTMQTQETGSQQQLSRLSSVRSSVYLSEFSEGGTVEDRVSAGLQHAFLARPIFWPKYFFIFITIISVLSFAAVVSAFAVTESVSTSMDNQVELSKEIHDMAHKISLMFGVSMLFTTHNVSSEDTITGQPFDSATSRRNLSLLSQQFDKLLSQSFSRHSYMPNNILLKWVDDTVQTDNTDTDITAQTKNDTVPTNPSLMTAIRIYQLRAMTLAYTPSNDLGTLKDPSPEAILVTYLYPATASVSKTMIKEISKALDSDQKTNDLMIYSVLACILGVSIILTVIFIPVTLIGYKREYDFMIAIIQSIPPKVCKKMMALDGKLQAGFASSEISFDSNSKKISKKYYKFCQISMLYVVSCVIVPLPLIISVVAFKKFQSSSEFICTVLQLSTDFVADFGFLCLYSYRIVSGFPSPYTRQEELDLLYQSGVSTTSSYRELFFGGTDAFPVGIMKKYPNLMEKISIQKCSVILGEGNFNVSCMSFHDMVFFIFDQINRICGIRDEDVPTKFNSNWWRKYYPVVNRALMEGITEYFQMLTTISNDFEQQRKILLISSLVLGIIFFIAIEVIAFSYMKLAMDPHLRRVLKPLTMLPPECLTECQLLYRYLQGDYDFPSRQLSREKKGKKTESAVPLIEFITEGVLVMTPDGTIIASNKKYHEMMSNTAEETLGLNIKNRMPQSLQPLFDVLQVVKSGGQYQPSTTIETVIFTEDDRDLQVRITLVVQQLQEHSSKPTCAFIIYDRSDLIKAQAQLRKEKANVEQLLDSILPHNIAVSLLNGQTEITFEAAKGLVLFSDLVSFTPMCSQMSAKQIMTVLNLLFTNFDNELAKYQRLTKLKTIGDAYVCATGIFEGDGPIEEAACEIVQFGIRMQEIVPMLNKKHNLSLRQRVGIHCGGPLICGVLGKEKPLFEVIGQTVELAEDMETYCLPEKVHISQPVVDLVAKLKLNLEERTGVTMHGIEGKTWTVVIEKQ
ncbi:Adenylate and Guanylate cyclase catalytic domain containing protein [Trichomonas vaginalis G3]|uniref:Adenylate and Guanylate cyclase catalytic domain containing protein n=1 Tax=Trichomonas vaginalis (strain ATCC PRA-98 / G3) TaxID=412133 RepID=A2GB93_TRIV3|nr:Adenylate and Guanylate cyclase catalytic domain containing protein [Trichomonas vaginalis G3]|eukprot:XP_001298506.1 Adenylate and Guanylate cyclase catalytic domain containing protein [Trichomonas vaginalis G3]